jgi:hypothetical protein
MAVAHDNFGFWHKLVLRLLFETIPASYGLWKDPCPNTRRVFSLLCIIFIRCFFETRGQKCGC